MGEKEGGGHREGEKEGHTEGEKEGHTEGGKEKHGRALGLRTKSIAVESMKAVSTPGSIAACRAFPLDASGTLFRTSPYQHPPDSVRTPPIRKHARASGCLTA